MTTEEIITELQGQRVLHIAAMEEASKNIQRLDAAIAVLNGSDNGGEVMVLQPKVIQCIEEAARTFTAKHAKAGIAVVFDNKNLTEEAIQLHPALREKIKTGVYAAVTSLLRKNKFRRAQGGYELVNP
jgi:hypothetical protein